MTSDRPIYRRNYQWKERINVNYPMACHYDVIFYKNLNLTIPNFFRKKVPSCPLPASLFHSSNHRDTNISKI